ncbi:hypothetical protein V1508DRAFT_208839, partial [Lipomyces doorenjongii]|uniref:uncharacterized protein n=1 Tax=Lipomyces doorenjongii TaxID=383834 RepID=UPI0034CD093A
MERFIIHLIPARLEKLFMKYLIYIRPFEKLLAGALYKVTNSIIEGYQQYLFTGHKGRYGAERLREIIQHKSASSTALHTKISAQELRQALVAFLDQYAGHSKAVSSFTQDLAHDVQSGHSTHMAVTHYAVSDQDLPSTNRYDVHVFMLVSEAWFKVLGEESPIESLKRRIQNAEPSAIGQSVEHTIPATREVSNTVEHTTVVREVTEVYSEAVDAKLLPVSTATFQLLHDLRGSDSQFLSPLQGAAVQTIISNPGYSFLVVLPTGGGKSDVIYLTSLYEFKNGRITMLVVPFVALRYDILDRANALGLSIVQWSPTLTTTDIIGV